MYGYDRRCRITYSLANVYPVQILKSNRDRPTEWDEKCLDHLTVRYNMWLLIKWIDESENEQRNEKKWNISRA